MAGVNQGDLNSFICLPLTHFIGKEASNCLKNSFMNLFSSVGYSRVISVKKFPPINECKRFTEVVLFKRALKTFLLTFVWQKFIIKKNIDWKMM